MHIFISALVGASLGVVIAHILFKVFHENNKINESNKDEILREMERIDWECAVDKLRNITSELSDYEKDKGSYGVKPERDLRQILTRLDRHRDWLVSGREAYTLSDVSKGSTIERIDDLRLVILKYTSY